MVSPKVYINVEELSDRTQSMVFKHTEPSKLQVLREAIEARRNLKCFKDKTSLANFVA